MISLFIFHQGTTEDRITLRADKRKEFSILCFSSFLAQLYAVFSFRCLLFWLYSSRHLFVIAIFTCNISYSSIRFPDVH